MVTPAIFKTHSLPPIEQFEAWRDFNASVVEIALVDRQSDGFAAEHLSWNLGEILFTQALLPPVERCWSHLPRSHMDHFCVVLAGRGGTWSHLSCRSLVHAYQGRGTDDEVLTLFLPRDLVRGSVDGIGGVAPRPVNAGLGYVLADYMQALARRLPEVPRDELPALEAATRALVLACVVPTPHRVAEAEKPMAAVLVERARRIVAQNVARSEFNPDELGRVLSVSRSRLYRLFAAHGGVAHFIQEERLEEANRRLVDARNAAPINVLASEVGFLDHSTFSRAFKRKFGQSPSEVRERAMATRLFGLTAPDAAVREGH